MRNGRLRNLIRVMEKTVTNDPRTNEEIVVWRKKSEVFVSYERKAAKEFERDGQRFAMAYVRFTGHFFDLMEVKEAMRISFNGENYDIMDVRPDHQMMKDVEIDAVLIK